MRSIWFVASEQGLEALVAPSSERAGLDPFSRSLIRIRGPLFDQARFEEIPYLELDDLLPTWVAWLFEVDSLELLVRETVEGGHEEFQKLYQPPESPEEVPRGTSVYGVPPSCVRMLATAERSIEGRSEAWDARIMSAGGVIYEPMPSATLSRRHGLHSSTGPDGALVAATALRLLARDALAASANLYGLFEEDA